MRYRSRRHKLGSQGTGDAAGFTISPPAIALFFSHLSFSPFHSFASTLLPSPTITLLHSLKPFSVHSFTRMYTPLAISYLECSVVLNVEPAYRHARFSRVLIDQEEPDSKRRPPQTIFHGVFPPGIHIVLSGYIINGIEF